MKSATNVLFGLFPLFFSSFQSSGSKLAEREQRLCKPEARDIAIGNHDSMRRSRVGGRVCTRPSLAAQPEGENLHPESQMPDSRVVSALETRV